MTKTAKIDFATTDAATIVDAIMNRITTMKSLNGFRDRAGGAAKADKLYPNTREALNLLKDMKQQKRKADAIRATLAPYNARLAAGETVEDILSPILSAWREYHVKNSSLLLMPSQILMLKVIESATQLEELTGKPVSRLLNNNRED